MRNLRSGRSIGGTRVAFNSFRILIMPHGGYFACHCLPRRRLHMAALPNDPERAAAFIVHLRQKNPSMRHSAHNWIETASMVSRKAVAKNPALINLKGSV